MAHHSGIDTSIPNVKSKWITYPVYIAVASQERYGCLALKLFAYPEEYLLYLGDDDSLVKDYFDGIILAILRLEVLRAHFKEYFEPLNLKISDMALNRVDFKTGGGFTRHEGRV